jgi:hypothetical protein
MASGFPASIDNFTDPLSNSPLNSPSHSALHSDVNDAVEKIETYMGLVKVTSGTTAGTTNTLSIPTSFTSLYEHYLLQLTVRRTTLTADATLNCQLYASGSVVSAASTYAYASDQRYLTTQSNSGTNAEQEIPLGRFSDKESVFNITFNSPQNVAIATQIQSFNTNVQTGFTVDANRCVGIRRAEEINEGVFFWSAVNFISSWVLYGYRK